METQELELTQTQILADIHNMLSDIHEAMFSEEDMEEETESESDAAELEEENRRLKRMYADLSMQNDLLKEALGKK